MGFGVKTVLKTNVVVLLRTFLSLVLNFSSNTDTRTSKLWRVYGQLLLREIGYRHQISPDYPFMKPYLLYERHLSDVPEHLSRFQNFMAQTRIFRFLLASDWLDTLSGTNRDEVNTLLLRIRDEDNVYHSYRNSSVLVQRANSLGIYDDDDMDFYEPDASEYPAKKTLVKPSAAKEAKITKPTEKSQTSTPHEKLTDIPAKTGGLLSVLANGFGYAVILPATFLLASVVALPLFFLKPVQAWAARMKIGALVRYDYKSNDLAQRLSMYENRFADTERGVEQMARLAVRTRMFDKLVSSDWIYGLSEPHLVMVSSLLRRLTRDRRVAKSIENSGAKQKIIVHEANKQKQLTRKNSSQIKDIKLFGPVKVSTQGSASSSEDTQVPKTTKQASGTSEQQVKNEGWLQTRGGPYTRLSDALRKRHYDKALSMCDDKTFIDSVSNAEALNLLALKNYMAKPTAKSSPLGRRFKDNLNVQSLFDRKITKPNKRHLAAKLLFGDTNKHGVNEIRSLWLEAQEHMLNDDALEVSSALENIASKYASIPQNRITQKRVSYDTFLVTALYAILENAKDWLDWYEEHPTVLLAFAHCAVLAGHADLSKTLFRIIDGHSAVKLPLKQALAQSYLGQGFHTKAAISSVNNLEQLATIKPLNSVDKAEKVLCLVETSASIDDLFGIDGLSKNVACAPVQPAVAANFPIAVDKIQVEDHISMYSVEDMDIGDEVDRLTGIAVNAVTKQFSDNSKTQEWADFVEVVHATVFFSIYRDIMAVALIEKLVAKAKDYDKVIFILKNGVTLNVFFKGVIKSVGVDNVYFSLSNARKSEQDTCVHAVLTGTPDISQNIGGDKNKDWRKGFSTWMHQIGTEYKTSLEGHNDEPYALHLLEHLNGYFDSYASLVKENLAYSNVELVTGPGHKQLNEYIESPAAKRLQKSHTLTRYIPRRQVPPSNTWMPQLAATMENCFDDIKSPFFPKYKSMILWRAQNFVSYRLAQVLDLAAYFKARFDVQPPTHVFTGPNQHLASRTASILGQKRGVPVYDFLILAVTNHKRYRPPISDVVYVYDEFYRGYYDKYLGISSDKIRVSGPLFDYSQRFDRRSKIADKAGQKRHVVFFSQSANYDTNVMIIEDVCKSLSGLENVYLTIKLHPHESATNVGRYGNVAKEHGMKNNVSVWHRDADAIDLVNQADLVVQSFSNVGLDAFLLKKPVITVNFAEKSAASIFLFEKGVGKQVKTRAALRKATIDLLEDPKAKAAMARKAAKFAKDNELYFEAENAKRVLKEVIADVGRNAL